MIAPTDFAAPGSIEPNGLDGGMGASGLETPEKWFTAHVYPHVTDLRTYLAGRFGLDGFTVDDVVQEALLRIWRKLPERPMMRPKAFLFAVARNLVFDRFRHRRAGPWLEVTRNEACRIADPLPDAAQTVTARDDWTVMKQSVAGLPPKMREVFLLCRVEGLKRRDVAHRLGISLKTVDGRLRTASHQCAQYIAEKTRPAIAE